MLQVLSPNNNILLLLKSLKSSLTALNSVFCAEMHHVAEPRRIAHRKRFAQIFGSRSGIDPAHTHVWVTKLTAETLQNLIQSTSPCQTSSPRCQFTFSLTLSLPWTSTLSLFTSQFTCFNVLPSEKVFPWHLKYDMATACYVRQTNPCYHNHFGYCFSSCHCVVLYMHVAVANTTCH